MEIEVRRDDDCYVALLDGRPVGSAFIRAQPGRVVFTHTEVAPEAEGMGVASALIRGALDDVRRQNEHAVPLCPFVAAYLKRHPEYADLVA